MQSSAARSIARHRHETAKKLVEDGALAEPLHLPGNLVERVMLMSPRVTARKPVHFKTRVTRMSEDKVSVSSLYGPQPDMTALVKTGFGIDHTTGHPIPPPSPVGISSKSPRRNTVYSDSDDGSPRFLPSVVTAGYSISQGYEAELSSQREEIKVRRCTLLNIWHVLCSLVFTQTQAEQISRMTQEIKMLKMVSDP